METKIKKEIILFLVLSLFFISLIYAVPDFGSIPPIPDYFYGNVLIDGNNASVGTQIKVYVGGNLEQTYNVTEAGKYDLYVTTGNLGNSIEFKILDKLAASPQERQGGEITYLDLSISTTSAPSGDSGGSALGGGGGGGGGGISSGSSGGIISQPPATINESASDSEENQTQIQEIGDQKTTGIGITGGVILDFVKSGKGIGAVIVIGIIVGIILIKFKTPKWRRN